MPNTIIHPILNTELFDQAIDFSKFNTKDLAKDLKKTFEDALKQRDDLIAPQEEITWENTILPLEHCGEDLERILSVVYNFFSANTNDDIQELVQEYSPKLSDYSNSITLSDEVFKRVKYLYDNTKALMLTAEEKQLLKKTYEDFVRNGALLSPSQKDVLRKIDSELSEVSPKFSKNVLDATNAFELVLEEKDLDGLPESAIEAASADAQAKGLKGKYLVTLDYPSYIPFMKYAKNRELRKKLFTAMANRSYKDKFDNQGHIKNMVRLRDQKAKILGFKNYAQFILSNRMAETEERVFSFLERLKNAALPKAKEEVAEVAKFAKDLDQVEMKEWDFSYYSEKLKQKKFNFDAEKLRPYFKLENVLQGAFDHANRLYGLTFKERKDLPAYHPDVTVYEVRDESGNYVGLFYADFFPRPNKRGGAWMTSYRDQGNWYGEVKRPHISIVCNFTKPTPTKPSLLTFMEVQTLFHEFGHSLHGLLSKCEHRSLGGTNVLWDFVELPSQIMENWTLEKEGLHLFAKHFETGELIPDDLIKTLQDSEHFLTAYACIRQYNFAYLDMIWHTGEPEDFKDISDFEKETLKGSLLFGDDILGSPSCSFSHIFAGGYAAGYYSYKWAEVLDADAFEFFKEKGIFNKDVATSFKENILSKGSTEHPMDLYKKFRGREPNVDALLRRDGLI